MENSMIKNEVQVVEELDPEDQVEEFAGGEVSARHGRVNRWLMVVYAILFVWSIYYGITFWGGLGPGLDY